MRVGLVRPDESPFALLSGTFHQVDEDGAFTIRSIPPGAWDVVLLQSVNRDGRIEAGRELRSRVTLEEGRTTEIRIDVSRFQTGQLNGTVRLDGVAYHGSLHLRCDDPEASISTDTDAEGRFSVVLDCGSWRPSVRRIEPTQDLMIAAPVVIVTPGRSVEAAFDLHSARTRLRIRTSNDMPAGNAKLVLHALDGSGVTYDTTAEVDGSLALITAPGSYAVRARIRSLTNDEAWLAALRDHGESALALGGAFVDVGTFTLPTAGDVVDLRLPPQWGK
jgi:hypothetical protein